MQMIITGALILVAVIHLLPVVGVLGVKRLSALYGLVLKPLPVENPERLVQLFNTSKFRDPGNGYSKSS